MKEKKVKSIRKQILSGYSRVIWVMCLLVIISLISLMQVNKDYHVVSNNRNNQADTQSALAKHYEWMEMYNVSLQNGTTFSGSLDPNTCLLGKWMAGIKEEDLADSTIRDTLNAIRTPHEKMHMQASSVLELSKTDKEAASTQFTEQIKPLAQQVIAGLGTISNQYQNLANDTSAKLDKLILVMILLNIMSAFVGFFIAIFYGNRSARQISGPITAVAEWSERLSNGADQIDFDTSILNGNEDNEIGSMIHSFQRMVESVQENVQVVKRLAEGDMTVFVNIRSKEDTLGKHLYHLVQSNDFMFAKIIKIAMSVANTSHHIANASQLLADTASKQAAAVNELNGSTEETRTLVEQNSKNVAHATQLSQSMRQDMQDSNAKMKLLVKSVDEINQSSLKIANVIKLIDDIAFQTNILALNAAVEAARAGEAGKGFAVVADEVRNLAAKSAEASQSTSALIGRSIAAVNQGTQIADATAKQLESVVAGASEIVETINGIAADAQTQAGAVEQIQDQIGQITSVVQTTSSTAEESAATSQELSAQAGVLKQLVRAFNLRQK